jgi:uncharacterized membrane protein
MRKIIHTPLLAHHRREHINRCVLLPLGRAHLALCARCLGFYPALFGGLWVQATARTLPWGALDWWLILLGQVPVLLDWSIGRFNPRGGSNTVRILTGILAGLAFSRSFYLYFIDSKNELFWTNLLAVAIVVVAVEIVRSLNLRNLR